MNQLGSYEFRWTCTIIPSNGAAPRALCRIERALTSTTLIVLQVPEPGTIAGLLMGLSALGLIAVKKLKHWANHVTN